MALEPASVPSVSFLSGSSDATERLGEQLGRALDAPVLIALDGELGAGKTCFVRGLARGLDVRDAVSSPTYALLQSYKGRMELHHLDAWMEGRERAFLSDGGLEWVGGSGVAVIEWAERVADVLPRPHLAVHIDVASIDERRITLTVRADDLRAHDRQAPDRGLAVRAVQVLAAALDALHADTDLERLGSAPRTRRG
jgi:tRNA threonylcarbamoyladenosine biosynthesis protein TsaE